MAQAQELSTQPAPCQFYRPCPHPESEHDERRAPRAFDFSSYDPCRTCAAERNAKEQAERATAVREINALAREIAASLTGPGEPKQGKWTAQPFKGDHIDYGVYRELKRESDGQIIDIDRRPGAAQRGRLSLRASTPDDLREYISANRRYPQHSSITVGASRHPEAIAREIETRLLPLFIADVIAIRAERDAWQARNESAQTAAERLAKAAGDPSAAQPNRYRERKNPVSFYAAHSEFEVYGEDGAVSVTIKARSVSLKTALRIATILAAEDEARAEQQEVTDRSRA